MSAVVFLSAHTHPTWSDFGATVWVAVVVAGAVAMWTVWKAVMLTLRPGEQEADHIKRQILLDPPGLDVSVSSAVGVASSPASGAPTSCEPDEVLDR